MEESVVGNSYDVLVQGRCIDHVPSDILERRGANEAHVHLKLVLENADPCSMPYTAGDRHSKKTYMENLQSLLHAVLSVR